MWGCKNKRLLNTRTRTLNSFFFFPLSLVHTLSNCSIFRTFIISFFFLENSLFLFNKIHKFKELMGHACSKVANTTALTTSVDHGSLIPQGIYTTDNDYDINIVRQLIRKGQLAPFYTGKCLFFLLFFFFVYISYII